MSEHRWRDAIRLLKENLPLVEKHSKLLWNLGWCYFKLERMDSAQKYLTKALQLAPKNHACKFALGAVYLEKKRYKKAQSILSEALQLKESYTARICLAFAYLAQGKIEDAEKTHREGINLKPKKSRRYKAYADFLSDVGRETEAVKMYQKAKELQRIN
jgi:Tfp pilus assembly protein PilF